MLCSLLPVVPPALPVPATNQNQYLKHILLLKKNDYFTKQVNGMIQHFFNDSKAQFASFFAKNADLSMQELEELQALLKQKMDQKKAND